MSKKLILVELPERKPYYHREAYEEENYFEDGKNEGFNDCLDALESKSVKVDVGKLKDYLDFCRQEILMETAERNVNEVYGEIICRELNNPESKLWEKK